MRSPPSEDDVVAEWHSREPADEENSTSYVNRTRSTACPATCSMEAVRVLPAVLRSMVQPYQWAEAFPSAVEQAQQAEFLRQPRL